MADTKNVIFIHPLTETLTKLMEILKDNAKSERIELYECQNLEESIQTVPNLAPAMVLGSDPRTVAQMLLKTYKQIRKKQCKTIIVAGKALPRKSLKKLDKLGLTDFIVEPIAPKTLLYKIRMQIRALPSNKKQDNLEYHSKSDTQAKEEEKKTDKKELKSKKGPFGQEDEEKSLKHLSQEEDAKEEKKKRSSFQDSLYQMDPKKKKSNLSDMEVGDDDLYARPKAQRTEEEEEEIERRKKLGLPLLDEDGQDLYSNNSPDQGKTQEEGDDYDDELLDDEDDENSGKFSQEADNIDGHLKGSLSQSEDEEEDEVKKKNKLDLDLDDEEDDLEEDFDDKELEEEEARKNKLSLDLEEDLEDDDLLDEDKEIEEERKRRNKAQLDLEEEEEGKKKKMRLDLEEDLGPEEEEDEDIELEEDEHHKEKLKLELEEEEEEDELDDDKELEEEKKSKDNATLDLEDDSEERKKNAKLDLEEDDDEDSLDNKKKKEHEFNEGDLLDDEESEEDKQRKRNAILDFLGTDEEELDKPQNDDDLGGSDRKKNKLGLDLDDEEDLLEANEKDPDKKSGGKRKSFDSLDEDNDYERDTFDQHKGPKKSINRELDDPEIDDDWNFDKNDESNFDDFKLDKENEHGALDKNQDAREEVLDYSKIIKDRRKGIFKQQDDEQLNPESDGPNASESDAKSDNIFDPSTNGIEHTIASLGLYQNKRAKPHDIFSFFSNAMYQEKRGKTSFFLVQSKNKEFTCLYNGHKELPHTKSKDELQREWEEFVDENMANWKQIKIPAWQDNTFQADENQYFYPFFEGKTQVGFGIVQFPKSQSEDDTAFVETLLESSRGVFLQELHKTGSEGDYNREKGIIKPKKKKGLLGRLFGKKAS